MIVASYKYCITALKSSGLFADGNESLRRQLLSDLQSLSPTMIRLFILPDNLFNTDCAGIRAHPMDQSKLRPRILFHSSDSRKLTVLVCFPNQVLLETFF